jgi:hypothetical protein
MAARRPRGARQSLAIVLVAAAIGSVPARAADDYDPLEAGHPVRIVAYVLHPIGVAFDYLLMRPARWVVNREPFRTIFGNDDH